MQDEDDHGARASGAWPRIERIRTDTSAIRRFHPPSRRPGTGHGHSLDDDYENDDSEFEDDEHDHFRDKGKGKSVASESGTAQIIEPGLKPGLIAEILRTRHCIPGLIFLVERIDDLPIYLADEDHARGSASEEQSESDSEWEEDVRPKKRTVNNLAELVRKEQREQRAKERLQRRRERMRYKARHRMVRLMLGDGELCIQALLKPANFGLLGGGLIYEGCYVRLGNFEVVETEVDDFGQPLPEREKKEKTRVHREDDLFGDPALVEASRTSERIKPEKQERGRNKMFYLVVGEMVTVGWNSAYLGLLRQQAVGANAAQEVVTVRNGKVTSTGPGIVVPASEEVAIAAEETAASGFALDDAAPGSVAAADSRPPIPATKAFRQSAGLEHGAAIDSRDTIMPHAETMVSPYSFAKTPIRRDSGSASRGTSPRKFLPHQAVQHPSPGKPKPMNTAAIPCAKLNYDDIEEYIPEDDLDDEAFEKLDISMDKVAERRLFDTQRAESPKPKPGAALQELETAVVEQNRVNAHASRTPQHNANLVLAITDPHQPLKLTPLRSIPHLPYKQNWMVNVLAVVVSLSEVEPAHLPPYTQRTARLRDLSTSKRVLLNVFLDPEEFAPAVGSVLLLVGVKNHRFDGGCLKKYASDRPPRDVGGNASWWLENPSLEWCQEEIEKLMAWWGEQQSQQQQEQDGELDKQMG